MLITRQLPLKCDLLSKGLSKRIWVNKELGQSSDLWARKLPPPHQCRVSMSEEMGVPLY